MSGTPEEPTAVPVPPEHLFKGEPNFCIEILFFHDAAGFPVYCGLRRNQHPTNRAGIPEPKDGP